MGGCSGNCCVFKSAHTFKHAKLIHLPTGKVMLRKEFLLVKYLNTEKHGRGTGKLESKGLQVTPVFIPLFTFWILSICNGEAELLSHRALFTGSNTSSGSFNC